MVRFRFSIKAAVFKQRQHLHSSSCSPTLLGTLKNSTINSAGNEVGCSISTGFCKGVNASIPQCLLEFIIPRSKIYPLPLNMISVKLVCNLQYLSRGCNVSHLELQRRAHPHSLLSMMQRLSVDSLFSEESSR